MRIRLDLSYDGTDFKGWATQPSLRTVQGTLEEALATALRVPAVRVVCAGRTDTGVHARGQVVHLDVAPESLTGSAGRSEEPPMEALVRRLNGILPPDVRVRRALEAPAGFDARFSATWRRYAYRVADDPALVDPLVRSHVLAWPKPLDLDAMNAASRALLGLRDFASFCKRREGATTVRTLMELAWTRDDTGVAVARGSWPTRSATAWCARWSAACWPSGTGAGPRSGRPRRWRRRRRNPAVTVVHAHGLTLEEVGYPEGAELAAQAERARNTREAMDD